MILETQLVNGPTNEKTVRANSANCARTALVPSPKHLSELQLFTMPEGGVDRLHFVTWDTIEVIGFPEETIEFQGHYAIQRATPTSASWEDASIDITMLELSVAGVSPTFGRISAAVNPNADKKSGGQVKAGAMYIGYANSPKLCQMLGYMHFTLHDRGLTVFNKEPIVLEHHITHVPPVGQGGGTRGRVEILLYSLDNPDGPPIAILRQVRTHIGAWLES
jgi:hypothetical protein